MPTTTKTVSTTSERMYLGKPWGLPCAWKDPAGVAINITGFQISAFLDARGEAAPIVIAVANRNDVAGTWEITLNPVPADLELGGGSVVNMLVVDTAGNHHEFEWPTEISNP